MSPINARTGEIEHWLWRDRQIIATTNGPSCDIRHYDGLIAISAVSQGAIGGVNVCQVQLQHSANGTDWVTYGTVCTFTTKSEGYCVGYDTQALSRYIRVRMVLGAGAACTLAVSFRGRKQATCM